MTKLINAEDKITAENKKTITNPNGGEYEVIEELGRGGFAITYKAKRKGEKNVFVVVKKCNNNPTLFIKEAERIQELEGKIKKDVNRSDLPFVIPMTSVFEDSGILYYVMEYVPGETLSKVMNTATFETFPLKERLEIMKQLCTAVKYMHKTFEFVHQDISPNNVMIYGETGKRKLKVIDYGLATSLVGYGSGYEKESNYSEVKEGGTPGFFDIFALEVQNYKDNPELIDIYSLGAMLAYLYDDPSIHKEFIKKQNVYEKIVNVYNKIVSIKPSPSDGAIPFAIKGLIADAVNKDLNKRIKSAEEFQHRLQEIINMLDAPVNNGDDETPTNHVSIFDETQNEGEGSGDTANTDDPQSEKKDSVNTPKSDETSVINEPEPTSYSSLLYKALIAIAVVVLGIFGYNKYDAMQEIAGKPVSEQQQVTDAGNTKEEASLQENNDQADPSTQIVNKLNKLIPNGMSDELKAMVQPDAPVLEEQGGSNISTGFTFEGLFAPGNDMYLIGKTHRVKSVKYANDGKISILILEELK